MALVLCTGVDLVLLETRRMILQQAGHTVITVRDERALTDACQAFAFDVAVIGQTVSARMKKVVASLVREHCPSAKILELYPPYQGRSLDDADSWMEVPADVPRDLARRVTQLAAKETAA